MDERNSGIIIKKLKNREKMGSTVIDDEVALPHVKVDIGGNIVLVFRLKNSICWEKSLVKVVIVFLVSEVDDFVERVLMVLQKNKNIKKIKNYNLSETEIESIFLGDVQ